MPGNTARLYFIYVGSLITHYLSRIPLVFVIKQNYYETSLMKCVDVDIKHGYVGLEIKK